MSGVFTIPDEELQSESWRLMLRQETEQEKFDKRQKEIIAEVFREW